MKIKYTINYYYGSYEGTRTIYKDDDDERSPIEIVWAQLRPHMTLAMAARSATIVSREEERNEHDSI